MAAKKATRKSAAKKAVKATGKAARVEPPQSVDAEKAGLKIEQKTITAEEASQRKDRLGFIRISTPVIYASMLSPRVKPEERAVIARNAIEAADALYTEIQKFETEVRS